MSDPHPAGPTVPDGVPAPHGQPGLSVGDPATMKSRLLADQCQTCIFRPGNPMHLDPGRLRELVTTALSQQSFVICHDTLPYGPHPDAAPAICRGFYDRYTTTRLRVIAALFGFLDCDPPTNP